jgi:MFS family permease
MSMISDYFPVGKLARAISVYSMGVYFGAGLALIIGGYVIKLVTEAGATVLPVIGEVQPWQMTFFFVGLLGIPVLLLIMTIREPVRRGVARRGSDEAKGASSIPALKAFLRLNIRTVVWHFLAFSFFGIGVAGFLVWGPTFFIRTHGFDAPTIGFVYGIILLVGGTSGVYAGGSLADWLQRRGKKDAILRASLYSLIAVIPFAVFTPLAPHPAWAVAGLACTSFLLAVPQGLPAAALQVIAPNALRAQMIALYFLVANLIALGFGPTLYALVTDYVFRDPAMLRYSLALVSGLVLPLGAMFCYLALEPYRISVDRAMNIQSASTD